IGRQVEPRHDSSRSGKRKKAANVTRLPHHGGRTGRGRQRPPLPTVGLPNRPRDTTAGIFLGRRCRLLPASAAALFGGHLPCPVGDLAGKRGAYGIRTRAAAVRAVTTGRFAGASTCRSPPWFDSGPGDASAGTRSTTSRRPQARLGARARTATIFAALQTRLIWAGTGESAAPSALANTSSPSRRPDARRWRRSLTTSLGAIGTSRRLDRDFGAT